MKDAVPYERPVTQNFKEPFSQKAQRVIELRKDCMVPKFMSMLVSEETSGIGDASNWIGDLAAGIVVVAAIFFEAGLLDLRAVGN